MSPQGQSIFGVNNQALSFSLQIRVITIFFQVFGSVFFKEHLQK